MDFLLSVGKGILIGIGAVVPGISSGVLCVIFGIYEKLIDSVLGIFKDFKRNMLFLLPIVLGTIIGFLLFGNILNYAFANFEAECKLLFLGLILGSVPSLIKDTNSKSTFKLHYLIYTLFAFLLGLFLFLLENKMTNLSFISNCNTIYLIFSGFAMSAGIVIPGVSSTVLLMCFGIYDIYLQSLATLNLSILIPMGIGCLIGGFIFLLLIRFLFKRYYTQTSYSIIGFVLGSTFVLIPNTFTFTSIILFFVGFIIAFKLENLKKC